MAQGKIQIKFEAKGDKALQLAIMNLDVATKRLTNQTSIYEKHLKNVGLTQKQANKFLAQQNKLTLFGVKNQRLLGNAFATVRSKLLLYSFGIGLVTAGLKQLLDKSIIQEKAEKKLETALGEVNTALLNQASALQQVTTFGDEAIIEVQALVGAFVKDEEAIKAATKATLDLAAAKGMDLKSAGDLVSKTLGSSTNSLSRYGIEVTGAVGSTQRLESLTTNIAVLFGGQASAAADTLGGSIEQMTNAFGDSNEAIGKAFTPIIKQLAGFFKETAEAATEFFLTMTEDPLETTIRHIEKMGGNADDLKRSFLEMKEVELAPKVEGLGTLADMQKNINNQNDYRLFILGEIGKQEEDLMQRGFDLNALQDEANRLITKGQFDFNEGAYQKAIAQQQEAKNLLSLLDMYKANLAIEDENLKAMQDNQTLLLEYEAIIARIAALTGESTGRDLLGMTPDQWGAMEENVSTWSNAIMDVANQYMALQQAQLNAGKQRELDAASNIKWEKKRQKEIEKINAKYEAKQAQVNKKVRRLKRAQTIVNTATGIMEVMADDTIKSTAGKIIMATLVGVMGAMQLATIDAQKYAQGGYVGGRRHSQGGTLIEAEQGEYVISRRGVEAAGIETLNRINAGGGSGSVNISFSGNVMSKDFIEDEAIPQIKEAIRRGADIGIG